MCYSAIANAQSLERDYPQNPNVVVDYGVLQDLSSGYDPDAIYQGGSSPAFSDQAKPAKNRKNKATSRSPEDQSVIVYDIFPEPMSHTRPAEAQIAERAVPIGRAEAPAKTRAIPAAIRQPVPEPKPALAKANITPRSDGGSSAVSSSPLDGPPPPPSLADPAPIDPPAPASVKADPPVADKPKVSSVKPQKIVEEASVPAAALPAPSSAFEPQLVSIPYQSGVAAIPDQAVSVVSDLAHKLQADPDLNIRLDAYARAIDKDASQARRLSLQRAIALRGALADAGVASSRIIVRALGDKVSEGSADRVDIEIGRN